MRAALRSILGDAGEKRIQMGMARDGSGVGGTYSDTFLDPRNLD